MFIVKEDTTLVGISELRTNFNKVIDALGRSRVLLERRNKPVAVIVSIERYELMEKLIESIEDTALGELAKERDLKSAPDDYIDIDTAQKKLKGSKK